MTKKQFWNQFLLFVSILLLTIITREYFSHQLIKNDVRSYQTHTLLSISANIFLIIISIFFIKKNKLEKIAGINGTKLKKWFLLIFPLIFLSLLNLVLMDNVNTNILLPNIFLLLTYSLSIGFAEELSIRGFLQSSMINYLGTTKKNITFSVFASALFFGLIHIINFENGIYGELAQIIYATFIGVMFGFLLVITKRIYPLIVIHSIIDFVGDLDSAGLPIKDKISEPMSIENALIIILLVSPCLFYGIFLMKKYKFVDENKK